MSPSKHGSGPAPTSSGSLLSVGHLYLDVRRQILHCLNTQARELHTAGIPFLPADLARQPLQTLAGEAVAAKDLPLMRAWRDNQSVAATFLLYREHQPVQQVAWTATPLRDSKRQVAGVVGTVTVNPPEPDWQALAGLAHDLRTPLQALQLLVTLLESKTEVAPDVRELFGRVRSATERALEIGLDLLEWCRAPVQHARRGTPVWFALEPFLTSLANEQAIVAQRKLLALVTNLEAARGWEAYADRVRVGRLLVNLLANAIRYTTRGRVEFTASWREAAASEPQITPEATPSDPGRTLVLSVVDTGTGISAEEQESIFQPFERGKAGKESDSGGSGLGLAVVDRLVEELNLTLEVYSEYGHGSAFHLLLPAKILRRTEVVE